MLKKLIIPTFLLVLTLSTSCLAQPPYSGTIFIDPDIITSKDSSTIVSTTYTGQGLRTVYDRRIPGWTTINAYLFNIIWADGITSEAQINPEFGTVAAATTEANKYAKIIGRLPSCLRIDVAALWIHKGVQPFGGGNNSILIHTGQAASYESQGILEEALVHEASHTSLDATHASDPGWIAAQTKDNKYISTYAASNPQTEDVAESFLTWIAVRQCTSRISQYNYKTISQTIPNRLLYFDDQKFEMYPLCMQQPTGITKISSDAFLNFYPNPFHSETVLKTNISVSDATLTIYNIGGQAVRKFEHLSGRTMILSRENLPAGFYFAILFDRDRIIAGGKIVILEN